MRDSTNSMPRIVKNRGKVMPNEREFTDREIDNLLYNGGLGPLIRKNLYLDGDTPSETWKGWSEDLKVHRPDVMKAFLIVPEEEEIPSKPSQPSKRELVEMKLREYQSDIITMTLDQQTALFQEQEVDRVNELYQKKVRFYSGSGEVSKEDFVLEIIQKEENPCVTRIESLLIEIRKSRESNSEWKQETERLLDRISKTFFFEQLVGLTMMSYIDSAEAYPFRRASQCYEGQGYMLKGCPSPPPENFGKIACCDSRFWEHQEALLGDDFSCHRCFANNVGRLLEYRTEVRIAGKIANLEDPYIPPPPFRPEDDAFSPHNWCAALGYMSRSPLYPRKYADFFTVSCETCWDGSIPPLVDCNETDIKDVSEVFNDSDITASPSNSPSQWPTIVPTEEPTRHPTMTFSPSSNPSMREVTGYTVFPTKQPTFVVLNRTDDNNETSLVVSSENPRYFVIGGLTGLVSGILIVLVSGRMYRYYRRWKFRNKFDPQTDLEL